MSGLKGKLKDIFFFTVILGYLGTTQSTSKKFKIPKLLCLNAPLLLIHSIIGLKGIGIGRVKVIFIRGNCSHEHEHFEIFRFGKTIRILEHSVFWSKIGHFSILSLLLLDETDKSCSLGTSSWCSSENYHGE